MKYPQPTSNLLYWIRSFWNAIVQILGNISPTMFQKDPVIHSAKRKIRLSRLQKEILIKKVDFYNKLNKAHQEHFEHRLATFIRTYEFIGRDGYEINAETKVLIGSSYTMLTFGKRKFITDVFNRIIIYPDIFLSTITQRKHKGEFNPRYKTVVFSWRHFMEGVTIKNDGINLAIHEFTHIIHIKSLKKRDMSSLIFRREYQRLINYLQENEAIRKRILESNYFRQYAFENQYEFVAVLIENFIETPHEFKRKFPAIYKKIKRMLNFNFPHY
jgi:Mlc titration factor MtfA (ptsG expression regulator)